MDATLPLANGQGFESQRFPTVPHDRHRILIGATERDGRVASFEEVQVQHAVGVLITGTQRVLHRPVEPTTKIRSFGKPTIGSGSLPGPKPDIEKTSAHARCSSRGRVKPSRPFTRSNQRRPELRFVGVSDLTALLLV
jgi:hypothetical protein